MKGRKRFAGHRCLNCFKEGEGRFLAVVVLLIAIGAIAASWYGVYQAVTLWEEEPTPFTDTVGDIEYGTIVWPAQRETVSRTPPRIPQPTNR